MNLGPHFVIVSGPPAAGKSTLGRSLLAGNPRLYQFVVAHELDVEKHNDTALWRAMARFAERGAWIPDALVLELFAQRLCEHHTTGMLLHGLPANGTQAVMLRDLIETCTESAPVVLYLDAPDDVCLLRVHERRVCT